MTLRPLSLRLFLCLLSVFQINPVPRSILLVFTARCYAERGHAWVSRLSVCLCLSVCLSVCNIVVQHVLCENKVCETVRLLSILSVRIIKGAKVRALFAENKVRFARVEQLWSVTFRYREHIRWKTRNTSKIISWPNSLTLMRKLTSPWAIWCNGNIRQIRVE